ncbi:hypothetical protein [Novosphingobium malaysiense]|uniref:hypothetical protein n=1 Tax=Novosphingobium malaysiense TaxID=1348853 RepID=UPI000690FFD2|nr:hypothetical protein [Novosphingobium malaysiense]
MPRILDHTLLLSVPVIGMIWIAAFLVFPTWTPLPPTLSAADVAAFYSDSGNATRVQYAMIVFNWFEIGMVGLYAMIALQMGRMSHGGGPLAWVYMAVTLGGACMFAAANCFWIVAAYRPDRAPEAIQLLNDLGWICFSVPTGFLIGQAVTLAFAVFLDDRDGRVFPIWVGWLNVLAAIAWVPAAFGALYLTGPLAWNGWLTFDLRIGTFAIYNAAMFAAAWTARNRLAERDLAA